MSTKLIELKNGKLAVNINGIDVIKKCKGPIGVIAVAGKYRTGKSFLLNHAIVKNKNCFGVGNRVNACTRGLHIANEPIQLKSGDGSFSNTLVIDCEGFDSVEADDVHDSKIFTLAVMMSSMFVYNTQGTIDEHALQSLSTTVNISKILLSTKIKGSLNFPSFVWVVRDFALDLNNCSDNEYLENALSDKNVKHDVLRESVRNSFTNRSCVTLARPCTDEKKLQNISDNLDALRPEFQSGIKCFQRLLTQKTRTKQICNIDMDSTMFVTLIHQLVDLINDEAVLSIPSTHKLLNNVIAEPFVKKCINEFRDKLNVFIETNHKINISEFEHTKERIYIEIIEKINSLLNGYIVEGNVLKEFQMISDQARKLIVTKSKHTMKQIIYEILSRNGNIVSEILEYANEIKKVDKTELILFNEILLNALDDIVETSNEESVRKFKSYEQLLLECNTKTQEMVKNHENEIKNINRINISEINLQTKPLIKENRRLLNFISTTKKESSEVIHRLETDLKNTRDELVICDDKKNHLQSQLSSLQSLYEEEIRKFEQSNTKNNELNTRLNNTEYELNESLQKLTTTKKQSVEASDSYRHHTTQLLERHKEEISKLSKVKKKQDQLVNSLKNDVDRMDKAMKSLSSKYSNELMNLRSKYEQTIAEIKEHHLHEIDEITEKHNNDKENQRVGFNKLTSQYRDQNEICMRLKMDINRLKRKHGSDCNPGLNNPDKRCKPEQTLN